MGPFALVVRLVPRRIDALAGVTKSRGPVVTGQPVVAGPGVGLGGLDVRPHRRVVVPGPAALAGSLGGDGRRPGFLVTGLGQCGEGGLALVVAAELVVVGAGGFVGLVVWRLTAGAGGA